jgi:hypothetical protein
MCRMFLSIAWLGGFSALASAQTPESTYGQLQETYAAAAAMAAQSAFTLFGSIVPGGGWAGTQRRSRPGGSPEAAGGPQHSGTDAAGSGNNEHHAPDDARRSCHPAGAGPELHLTGRGHGWAALITPFAPIRRTRAWKSGTYA